MKFPGSIASKINKDKNGENVLHLETAEVILVYCNIMNRFQELCKHLFQINIFVNY